MNEKSDQISERLILLRWLLFNEGRDLLLIFFQPQIHSRNHQVMDAWVVIGQVAWTDAAGGCHPAHGQGTIAVLGEDGSGGSCDLVFSVRWHRSILAESNSSVLK